ncbi:CopG family transcriptional regulator [Prosthecochloris sp. GSB1]|uniref:type II toxin-antitoxin system ParD family antitoxin n=1 Tax=Prosthecochloris sp. GSB1 TaxID=281093 RepID=UPI000B8D03A3|nr:type II toxin-antitoxin system ParD family antitoxin [Prosthecochloris sp. GSB1]ASQ90461.1 CopG family transcriptional regulator [Prosthecochloris sp. GSB1]
MPINVNLTPLLEKMVRDKVNSGLYTSASEVIREALRLMDEQDSIRKAKLDLLRKDIRAGMESGPAAVWNPDKIKKAELKAARTRGRKAEDIAE